VVGKGPLRACASGSAGPSGWRLLTPSGAAVTAELYAACYLTPQTAWTAASLPRLGGAPDRPACSLTVLLTRSPLPAEETIRPLISRALLSATVSLALTESERDAAQAALGAPVTALFARSGTLQWLDESGRLLARADAHGLEPSAVLSTWVADEHAVALVDCLTGAGEAGLLRMALRLPVTASAAALELSLDRTRVAEALRLASKDGKLARTEASRVFGNLLLGEEIAGAGRRPTPVVAALAAQLCELLADMLEPELDNPDTLVLHDDATLLPESLSATVPAIRGTQDVVFERALSDVLAPACAVRNNTITFVAPTTNGVGLTPVPPRTPGAKRDVARPLPLAARQNQAVSLALAMTPALTHKPSAAELVASDLTTPIAQSERVRWWAAHDLVVPYADGSGEGPMVADPAATSYPDHHNPTASWAAPNYTLVVPNPNDDPATSAFLFSFHQEGLSGPGALRPGIDASIRFTVQLTDAPIGGQRPVVTTGESALLLIPFRNPTSGVTDVQTVAGDVTADAKTLRVNIRLADDIARLAYGALAYPGFQSKPALLKLSLSFRAWRLLPSNAHVVVGGKIAPVEIAEPEAAAADGVQVTFNPHRLEIQQRSLRVRLVPEGEGSGTRERDVTGLAPVRATHARELSPAALRLPATPLVATPQLIAHPWDGGLGGRPAYVQQTVVREQTIEVLFPCNQLGGLYRQQNADGTDHAVGCQDVLRLGEIAYRLYEELPNLRAERYRVFRSLAQPGRFLLLPARYRITRFGPNEPSDRAYRPTALLYGLLQPDPTQNRYYLTATLEPDVAPFEREALIEQLMPLSPAGMTPLLHLPTDPVCTSERSYQWALPGGLSTPEVTQLQNGFQISVSSGLEDALLLTEVIEHNGLVGSVTFALPDGMNLVSELRLDSVITGPYLEGPLRLTPTSGGIFVENPTERAIDVLELRSRSGFVTVNHTLQAGGRLTAASPGGDDVVVAFLAHDDPMTLQQLGIFVEDVTADVVYVNLVDLEAHGLTSLDVFCHLQGASEAFTTTLGDRQSAKVELTLPITDYLRNQILLYQVKTTPTSGTPSVSDWISWDLAKQGAVISITWDAISGATVG
jgi:hypothetical protein